MTRVLVISLTDLGRDPRVDRQIAALATRHEVVAAGLGPPQAAVEFVRIEAPPRTAVGNAAGVALILAHRDVETYWRHPTSVAVFERVRAVEADVVVANDLATLPLALRLGPPVVFDAHEHAPSQVAHELWWRVLIAPYMRRLCRRYVPTAGAMTTVSEGLADEYERETGVRATVVTNAPPRRDLAPTPVHEPVRVLHHGVAQPGRGLEEMVRLAALLDDRFTVDFVLIENRAGYRERLIRLARGNPRVRFPEPWEMPAIVEAANDYDVGLCLLPPVGAQSRFALPNKLFEFVQARLALAIGPSPEMARVVRERGCGIVAGDFEPETLAGMLNALDADAIAAFKLASHAAADELCAERNEAIVLQAVEDALYRARASS